MIRHCVFLRFRADCPESEIRAILDGFAQLGSDLPGVLSIMTGVNVSPEGLDRGNRHGFTIDFVDAGARDRYLADPRHVKHAERTIAALAGGLDGVTVLDLESLD